MSATISIAATMLLATPVAVAAYMMAASMQHQTVMAMDGQTTVYVAGVLLTVAGFLTMAYALLTQGPGMVPGVLLTLSMLNAFRLLEDLREYVPFGRPFGYQGG